MTEATTESTSLHVGQNICYQVARELKHGELFPVRLKNRVVDYRGKIPAPCIISFGWLGLWCFSVTVDGSFVGSQKLAHLITVYVDPEDAAMLYEQLRSLREQLGSYAVDETYGP